MEAIDYVNTRRDDTGRCAAQSIAGVIYLIAADASVHLNVALGTETNMGDCTLQDCTFHE